MASKFRGGSCVFVDRVICNGKDDPRIHTKQHEPLPFCRIGHQEPLPEFIVACDDKHFSATLRNSFFTRPIKYGDSCGLLLDMDKLIKALPKVLAASGASEEVAAAACSAAWNHAVGEGLSVHAIPLQLQDKTLVIAVRDVIWQKQLEQLRGQLLFRINAVLGQAMVTSIELRIQPGRFREEHATTVTGSHDRHAAIPIELVSAAAGIEDPGLRRAFLGAAVSCVKRLEKQGS